MEASTLPSPALLQAIVDASPLPIVAIDLSGNVILWSPAAQRLLGWSAAETLGRPLPLVPEDKGEEFRLIRQRELGGDSIMGLEVHRQRKDGSPIDLALWIVPIRDAIGRVAGSMGLLEDITERKRTRARLEDALEMHAAVLRSVPVVLYRAEDVGGQGNTWMTDNVLELTGFPASRFAADPALWMSRLHPDDRAAALAAIQSLHEGTSSRFQYRWLHADGAYRWFLDQAFLSRTDTQGCRIILGTMLDITERKLAEDALAERTRQLEAIRTISEELARELNLRTLLQLIIRRAVEVVGATGGIIRLWDEASALLVPESWIGLDEDAATHTLRLGEGVAGTAAHCRTGLIVNDFRNSFYATPRLLQQGNYTAVLTEPLMYSDRLLGVITLVRAADRGPFTGEDLQILGMFGGPAAIAIENARSYAAEVRQRREAEVLADLSRQINASLDIETVLQRVVEGAKELVGSDLAQIALRDPATDVLVFRYWAGARYARYDAHRVKPGKGVGGYVLATGQPFRTADYAADPRITKDYLAMAKAEGAMAEVAVPIRISEQVVGVLYVVNRGPRLFTDRDERTLLLLAEHAAIAIGNARLYETATTQARQLATLNELTRTLTTSLDPQVVMQKILEAVQVFLPGAAGRIREWVEGEKILRSVAHLGFRDTRTAGGVVHLAKGKGLSGIAIATGQPVVASDVTRDPRFFDQAWAESEGLVAGIVLPLLHGNWTVGVLNVYLREAHTFTNEEIEYLRAIAAAGAVALSNARLFSQLHKSEREHLHLSQRIVSAQEEERHKLSRELHDEAGQALTALRIGIELIRSELPADATLLQTRLNEAVALADATTDRIRRLAQTLRPSALSALGLNATLEGLCHNVADQTRLGIVYSGTEIPGVPDPIAIHLYRCLQEALTNVTRHARAHRVRVALTHDGAAIHLQVEDNGVGFDPGTLIGGVENLGLTGMRERLDLVQGRLEIASSPGCGTRIAATVPWRKPDDPRRRRRRP